MPLYQEIIPSIPGLQYQSTPGDGDCFYHAIALCLATKIDAKQLRKKAATEFKDNFEKYGDIIEWSSEDAVEQFVKGIEGKEQGDGRVIPILENALQTHIVVLNLEGELYAPNESYDRFHSPPLFILYHGDGKNGHYSAMKVDGTKSPAVILQQLIKASTLVAKKTPNKTPETTLTIITPAAATRTTHPPEKLALTPDQTLSESNFDIAVARAKELQEYYALLARHYGTLDIYRGFLRSLTLDEKSANYLNLLEKFRRENNSHSRKVYASEIKACFVNGKNHLEKLLFEFWSYYEEHTIFGENDPFFAENEYLALSHYYLINTIKDREELQTSCNALLNQTHLYELLYSSPSTLKTYSSPLAKINGMIRFHSTAAFWGAKSIDGLKMLWGDREQRQVDKMKETKEFYHKQAEEISNIIQDLRQLPVDNVQRHEFITAVKNCHYPYEKTIKHHMNSLQNIRLRLQAKLREEGREKRKEKPIFKAFKKVINQPKFIRLTDEFKHLLQASENTDDFSAHYELYTRYKLGLGTQKDANAAMKWFLQVMSKINDIKTKADQNHVSAQYVYGCLLLKGFGKEVIKDTGKARDYLLSAAIAGDRRAQYQIGLLFNKGEIANDFLRKATQQGQLLALLELGSRLFTDDFSEHREQKITILSLAIALGYNTKYLALDIETNQWIYTEKNCNEAIKIAKSIPLVQLIEKLKIGNDKNVTFSQNSDTMHPICSQINLAQVINNQEAYLLTFSEQREYLRQKAKQTGHFLDRYEAGILCAEDKIEIGAIKEMASQNNTRAQFVYGEILLDWRYSSIIGHNLGEAFHCIYQAAQKNYAPAQHRLGEIYRDKLNDPEMAKRYFKKAADQKYAPAQYSYSFFNSDVAKNVTYLEMAALQGYDAALSEVPSRSTDAENQFWKAYASTLRYERNSIGFELYGLPDETIAFAETVLTEMAENGYRKAMYDLGQLYHYCKNNSVEAHEKAIKWHWEAAKRGCPKSLYEIGRAYEIGKAYEMGVHIQVHLDSPPSQVLGWYELAAKQGHQQAQFQLGLLYYAFQSVLPGGLWENKKTGLFWLNKAAEQSLSSKDAQTYGETLTNQFRTKPLMAGLQTKNDFSPQSFFTVIKTANTNTATLQTEQSDIADSNSAQVNEKDMPPITAIAISQAENRYRFDFASSQASEKKPASPSLLGGLQAMLHSAMGSHP